jgi:hypothetical protein
MLMGILSLLCTRTANSRTHKVYTPAGAEAAVVQYRYNGSEAVVQWIETTVGGKGYGQACIDELLDSYGAVRSGANPYTDTMSSDFQAMINRMVYSGKYHIESAGIYTNRNNRHRRHMRYFGKPEHVVIRQSKGESHPQFRFKKSIKDRASYYAYKFALQYFSTLSSFYKNVLRLSPTTQSS